MRVCAFLPFSPRLPFPDLPGVYLIKDDERKLCDAFYHTLSDHLLNHNRFRQDI